MEDFSYEFGPGSFERTAKLTQKAVKKGWLRCLGRSSSSGFGSCLPVSGQSLSVRQACFVSSLPENVLDAIMRDDSTPSPIESKGKGGMIGITRADGSVDFTRSELERISNKVFTPTTLAEGTRGSYETAIRKVWTHFVSHGTPERMLPCLRQIFERVSRSWLWQESLCCRIAPGVLAGKLRKWMSDMALAVSPDCEKLQPGANPERSCRFYPPLFQKRQDKRIGDDGRILAISRQDVTDAVRLAVKLIGDSTDYISGRSLRRGGITMARQAGVPEDVVYRQSGHGVRRAGRDYLHEHSKEQLYAVSRAFGQGL